MPVLYFVNLNIQMQLEILKARQPPAGLELRVDA